MTHFVVGQIASVHLSIIEEFKHSRILPVCRDLRFISGRVPAEIPLRTGESSFKEQLNRRML
jgi:hypothetical protein